MKFKAFSLILFLSGSFMACTDLKETLNEDIDFETYKKTKEASALLKGCYDAMKEPYQDQARLWCTQQHTTDETLGPTRGGDWDDNGVWRVLHNHTWTADHDYLTQTFNQLLQVVFATTNLQVFNATPEQIAEARFLRAFAMYTVADGWNQVPFRQPGSDLLLDPEVLKGPAALDFIINELVEIIPDLPVGPVNRANKDAAVGLLMRIYLNKGTVADRANPSFPEADMDSVIVLANRLIDSNKYSLATNYFDNFAPNNDVLSTENIWTYENVAGTSRGSGNSVRSRWFCGLHYNMNPSGWNGFATLSDFYDSFEDTDARKKADYPGMTEVGGINAGFLIGQQVNANGDTLKDRKGNLLAFTREVSLTESGNNLEITGIRVIKYPIDYNNGDNVNNDYVFIRYADVLMMKAEALFRKNAGDATALAIVNEIRMKRGATQLGSLSADILLAERGREFYWEGNRRTDMIRFGKFLQPFQEKPAVSDEFRLLFPIPASAVAVNPNLAQNPGYK